MKPPTRLSLATAALTVFAACGGGGDRVVMELVAFKPEKLSVKTGATVTWHQNDPGFHTVTSGTVEQKGGDVEADPDGSFDSDRLPKGQTFEFEFDAAGSYAYFCSIHPATMRGVIEVG